MRSPAGCSGLTVACARCHDHKYDPIPTKDYYSLYSIFSNIREPKRTAAARQSRARSRRSRRCITDRLERIEKDYQEYRVRRNAEMVAFFKTQTADYLLAARDAEALSNTEIEELVRDRQLNQHVLARWRKYLRESKASGEPVFRLWHAAAAIPTRSLRRDGPRLETQSRCNPLVEAELSAKASPRCGISRRAYAAVLAKYDRAEPFDDPERRAASGRCFAGRSRPWTSRSMSSS